MEWRFDKEIVEGSKREARLHRSRSQLPSDAQERVPPHSFVCAKLIQKEKCLFSCGKSLSAFSVTLRVKCTPSLFTFCLVSGLSSLYEKQLDTVCSLYVSRRDAENAERNGSTWLVLSKNMERRWGVLRSSWNGVLRKSRFIRVLLLMNWGCNPKCRGIIASAIKYCEPQRTQSSQSHCVLCNLCGRESPYSITVYLSSVVWF